METDESPALSCRMYLDITPGMAQLPRRQIDAVGGDDLEPVATYVAAPFLMEVRLSKPFASSSSASVILAVDSVLFSVWQHQSTSQFCMCDSSRRCERHGRTDGVDGGQADPAMLKVG